LEQTLDETRSKKGSSKGELAKRSGVPKWVIRNIESETPTYVPSCANTALLGEVLGVPVGTLLGEREGPLERAYPPLPERGRPIGYC
jgi:DNA-binding XRE family transcriptional regulator